MKFTLENFDLIRIKRSAIDRYSLQSLFHHRLSDPPEHRTNWAQSAAHNINIVRASGNDGAPPVTAGKIHALILLSEAYLRVVSAYNAERKKDLIDATTDTIAQKMGSDKTERVFLTFLDEFPVRRIYRHVINAAEYLNLSGETTKVRAISLQTMIVSWLHSINPAVINCCDLFDMRHVMELSPFEAFIKHLEETWDSFPGCGPSNENLLTLLKKPMKEAPDSVESQLRYIALHWKSYLGDFALTLLSGADMISEENRPGFAGPGPTLVPSYSLVDDEPEAFSADVDWMPSVVMLAKNTYVWLEQLSREYGFAVDRLDKVPEDALFQISRRGFNALWLIGLWSRSPASRKIKQKCGNPEAAASAYSLFDYSISEDVGGNDAFRVFKALAWKFGIRLAGDMVPNHMGIDSSWVSEHPEWFVSTEHKPFAHYSFNNEDLSSDAKCSIFLEDHYYSKDDAAVVFLHKDHQSGQTRFIYHGNDGTGLPWNDTAQLDFLRNDVREHVINTIINVAQMFPIIRFDAAMTLAKKHFHRLWYPEPGQGGDIASRSWFGMTRQQFDELMPNEFWRDVVEQVAARVPDTLLLAEAFWLMEGFFVRTLGMHRVYNSAFMNMLSKEENQKYREVIKNTIEFDPEILKRYVNFMNNPDEEPAAIQFGKGDKYFGVCAMMSTLPGLPMFGHGQFEGFTEKYGMEYRRSYWNEPVDSGLMAHHLRVVTPLLKLRPVFAGAEFFRLYDFYTAESSVDENVFAYSNRKNDEKTLFIFNNCNQTTQGCIRTTAAWRRKDAVGKSELCQETLIEGLALSGEHDRFVMFFDVLSRRWYVRRSSLLKEYGFRFNLSPYQCQVFIPIREIKDTVDNKYEQVERYLQGGGCVDIEETWLDMQSHDLLTSFQNMASENILEAFDEITTESDNATANSECIDLDEFQTVFASAIPAISNALLTKGYQISEAVLIESLLDTLENHLIRICDFRKACPGRDRLLIIWFGVLMKTLQTALLKVGDIQTIDARISRLLEKALIDTGMEEESARATARLTEQLIELSFSEEILRFDLLLESTPFRQWIRLNRYLGTDYFNREAWEEYLDWSVLWGVIDSETAKRVAMMAQQSGFRLKEFLDALCANK